MLHHYLKYLRNSIIFPKKSIWKENSVSWVIWSMVHIIPQVAVHITQKSCHQKFWIPTNREWTSIIYTFWIFIHTFHTLSVDTGPLLQVIFSMKIYPQKLW